MPEMQGMLTASVVGPYLLPLDWIVQTAFNVFPVIAPIVMTADPDGWGGKEDLNPFKQMPPSEVCERVKMATRTIMPFGVPMTNTDIRSDRQLFPVKINRVPVVDTGNLNAVVDGLVE